MDFPTSPHHRRLQHRDIEDPLRQVLIDHDVPPFGRDLIIKDLVAAATSLMDRAVLESDLCDDNVGRHFAQCPSASFPPLIGKTTNGAEFTAECDQCPYTVTRPTVDAAVRAYFGVVAAPSFDPMFLLWSNEHHTWWGPNRAGYTTDPWQAGRYSEHDATNECNSLTTEDGRLPRAVMVPAPENGHTRLALYQIETAERALNAYVDAANKAHLQPGYRQLHITDRLDPGEYRALRGGGFRVCCRDCGELFITFAAYDQIEHPGCSHTLPAHGDPGE